MAHGCPGGAGTARCCPRACLQVAGGPGALSRRPLAGKEYCTVQPFFGAAWFVAWTVSSVLAGLLSMLDGVWLQAERFQRPAQNELDAESQSQIAIIASFPKPRVPVACFSTPSGAIKPCLAAGDAVHGFGTGAFRLVVPAACR